MPNIMWPGAAIKNARHGYTAVGTTSTLVLNERRARAYLLIQNDSDTVIYLHFGGNPAVVNQGIRLNANGSSIELKRADGSVYKGPVYAIHAGSGTKRLLVTEGD